MRGLELLFQPSPAVAATHPQLRELAVQIEKRWPDLPPPLVLDWSEGIRAVRALDSAVIAATSAVPTHLWAPILDPIIFRIIAPTPLRHGQPCLWYPLAAWRW
jgi:hypothetical protein